MMRSLVTGMLAACLALAAVGCSRSPRVTFYILEPAAGPTSPAPAAAPIAAPTAMSPAAASTAPAPAAPAPPAASAVMSAAPAAPAAPTGMAAAPAAPSVVVGPVTLPELVDRPQLVVRVAANRVAILEEERWAEPLGSEIPRVIAQDLGHLLGSSRVAPYQQSSAAHADWRVLLDVERFEASPGEGVRVEAVWSLHRGLAVSRTGRSRVHEPVAGEGYDALVAAYSRALLAVSTDLARAIRAEAAAGH